MVDNDKSTTKTNLSKIKILQVFVPWLKKESVSKNKFLQVLLRFLPWLKSNQYFILKISSTYQRRLINPFLQLQFWGYEIIALPILTFKFFLTFIWQILSNKRCNWVKNIFYLMQHVLRGNQLCAFLQAQTYAVLRTLGTYPILHLRNMGYWVMRNKVYPI